ncbi:MobV family relaxase [Sphingomonas sp. LR59]|uniref:MobV family relaxase n=1 Tax=Sphingomonas sp. LR59 TaxID=3050232 RepID=UPI002FE3B394
MRKIAGCSTLVGEREVIVMEQFGVLTFDDRGPIKSWARLSAINSHNTRAEQELNCDPTEPPPAHICGTGSLIADVKQSLRKHGIDPATLRKNACIAYEVILTATHSFFVAGADAQSRLGRWIASAYQFACRHWGKNRIASMVLHVDEHTPHLHVVLVPLVEKIFKRWPQRGKTWTLNGRVISGPGEYQRAHDAYAEAMAPLGLQRGRSGGGGKYRPYLQELADLEKAKADALTAADAAGRAEREAKRLADQLTEELTRQERSRMNIDDREARVSAAEQKIRLQEEVIRRARADINTARSAVSGIVEDAEMDRRDAAIARIDTDTDRLEAAAERRTAERAMDALQETIEHAIAFRLSLRTVPLAALPLEAINVLRAINGFERAAELTDLPANDMDELPIGLQQRFMAMRRGS